jgi:hypothetical protein
MSSLSRAPSLPYESIREVPLNAWYTPTGTRTRTIVRDRAPSLNDKHLIRVETIGQQVGAIWRNFDQILEMPEADMRLQGQDHPRLEFLMTRGDDIGFLLMPPGAHAMANQGNPVRVAMLTKLLLGKSVNGAHFDANAALFDGTAVDIPHDRVRAALFFGGFPNHNRAGLVAGSTA